MVWWAEKYGERERERERDTQREGCYINEERRGREGENENVDYRGLVIYCINGQSWALVGRKWALMLRQRGVNSARTSQEKSTYFHTQLIYHAACRAAVFQVWTPEAVLASHAEHSEFDLQ